MSQGLRGGEDFVPGELLVGVSAPQDRDVLVRRLEQDRPGYRTGGDHLAGLTIKTLGSSALKLQVLFSDTVKDRLRENPGAELELLEDLARQIKANNPDVRYAHPNWITRIDPVERLSPDPQNTL
jgi:hypothetical protein